MKQMGQEARLNYIVEELKKDSGSFRDMEVRPRDRRRVMRSLMNIRMPRPLPAGFLEIQDEFLRVFRTKDLQQLKRFHRQLDIISEGYRAQAVYHH